jgi:hypothetical protein
MLAVMGRRNGIEQLIISFAPQVASAPGCMKIKRGDCFDPRTLMSSVEFFTHVARAVVAVDGGVVIDLHNEGCVTDRVPQPARKNNQQFNDAMARAAASYLPKTTAITLSIILDRGLECVWNAMEVLGRYELSGRIIDVHAYSVKAVRLLPALNEKLRNTRRNVIIVGETSISNAETLRELQALPFGLVDEVLFWPSAGDKTCHATVAPPYGPPLYFSCVK